jgi:drug/metabolite transporter (DMT)-like permease
LAVVQPLLVSNVLFALPVHHRLRREPVRRVELLWAALLVTGFTGFLLVATAGVPTGHEPADRGPAVASAALVALAGLTLIASARRRGGTAAAALLGIATGVLFAVTASLLKVCTVPLTGGPLHLLGSWQLYGLIGTGASGILLTQLAYQAGPLSASLPTVVDPLVAILLGVPVFDEHLRHSPRAVVGEVLFLALLAVAAVGLGRMERRSSAQRSA